MSEYIDIDADYNEEDGIIEFTTNLTLTDDGEETYASLAEMEEGSPVAQALAVVVGIKTLYLDAGELTIIPEPDYPWHSIVADVTAVLKDFFL